MSFNRSPALLKKIRGNAPLILMAYVPEAGKVIVVFPVQPLLVVWLVTVQPVPVPDVLNRPLSARAML